MSERIILATIPFQCSRMQKEYPVKMPIDEVKGFLASTEKKIEVAQELSVALQQLPVSPDLVVYYKGKGTIMANVHDSNDPAVGRLVNELARAVLCAVPEPKPRKRKAAGTTETVEVDVEADGDV